MNKFITFYEWLEKQKNRKSPLGDLAADALRDPSFPKDVSSLDAVLAHLKTKQTSGPKLATARLAWQTYSREYGAKRTGL
jgi:uncharacterized protein YozE (UPF0346 family)